MPELPEVETIRLGLEKYLVGHTIESVEVRLAKMLSGKVENIEGKKVIGVRRFAKGLVIDLSGGQSIAVHIKMTGQLIYQGDNIPKTSHPSVTKVGKLPGPATHVIFHLDSNAALYYDDIRQFGWIKIVATKEVSSLPFFKELGPEPLKDLDFPTFKKIVQSKKTPIKPLLMEQKLIGGIGNIYANEALYLSQIHPTRKADSLTDSEIKKLFTSIEEVLKKGLEVGGSSEWQYVNALGEEGGYQKIFQIYGQVGKKCKNCGMTIRKVTLSGRGTFFCPNCQR